MGDLIFVSYAHKEFYFAESVALRLQRERLPIWFDVTSLLPGLDWQATLREGLASCMALVLIGSRAAFASSQVHAEWTAAQERGVPIYVVLFERVRLPAALKPAQVIAPGSRFERAIGDLAEALRAGAPPKRLRPPLLVRPLAVHVMIACLWSLLLLPLSLAALLALDITSAQWSSGYGGPSARAIFLASVGTSWLGLLGYVIYYASVFARRRRFRLTELRLALGFWPIAAFGAVEALFIEADSLIHSDIFGLSIGVRDENLLVLALIPAAVTSAVALLGLVLTLRSAAVFRWLPPGSAPDSARWKHNPPAPAITAVTPSSLPARTVRLLYQPEEGLIARDVRRVVKDVRDLREVDEGVADIQLVVLSSSTPRAWIEQFAGDSTRTIYVIGSSLDLPADLVAVHRNQWIDYRLRDASRLRALVSLLNRVQHPRYAFPSVPESLGELQVPRSVWFFSHTLRALGLIALAVGISGLLPFVRPYGLFSADDARHIAALVIGAGWFWLASQMTMWRIAYRWLAGGCELLASALLVAGVPQEYTWLYSGGDSGRTTADMVVLIATVLIVFAFARKGIAAWLPLPRRQQDHGATLRLSVWQQQWRVYALYTWLVLQLVLGIAGTRLLLA